MRFAQQLRAAMAADRLTNEAVAQKTGLSRYTIIKAKRDERSVSFATAKKIADACGFSLDSVTL